MTVRAKYQIVRVCPVCAEDAKVSVDAQKYDLWKQARRSGDPTRETGIYQVFPELSADEREILLSGTHPECWDRLWKMEEEE